MKQHALYKNCLLDSVYFLDLGVVIALYVCQCGWETNERVDVSGREVGPVCERACVRACVRVRFNTQSLRLLPRWQLLTPLTRTAD